MMGRWLASDRGDRPRTRWIASARGAAVAFAVIVTLGVIVPAAPGVADTSSKPYSVTMSCTTASCSNTNPASVVAGSTNGFSVTLANLASPQDIGSADITPPSGFTVSAPSFGGPGTANVVGNVVELRGLAIAPGGSITVTFSVAAPCTGGGTWTIEAKQANDFSGSPGNDFTVTASSGLTWTISSSCSLRFATQPADAKVNTIITAVTPSGARIEVDVVDGNGHPAASSSAPITVCLTAPAQSQQVCNPAPPLGGTTTQAASGGSAFFNDLTISLHGSYHLYATSPGITDAVSSSPSSPPQPPGTFTIWDDREPCASACIASANVPNTQTSQVNAPAGGQNSFLELELGLTQEPATCQSDGAAHAPEGTQVTTVQYNAAGTKTAVVTIDKSALVAKPSRYEVCYQSIDAAGNITIIDPLPSCTSHADLPPCVNSIKLDSLGDVVETIILNADDPTCW